MFFFWASLNSLGTCQMLIELCSRGTKRRMAQSINTYLDEHAQCHPITTPKFPKKNVSIFASSTKLPLSDLYLKQKKTGEKMRPSKRQNIEFLGVDSFKMEPIPIIWTPGRKPRSRRCGRTVPKCDRKSGAILGITRFLYVTFFSYPNLFYFRRSQDLLLTKRKKLNYAPMALVIYYKSKPFETT